MAYPSEPLQILDYKIQNKLPVAVENATSLDANRVMFLLNRILSGEYRARPISWTTSTRPTPASTPPVLAGEIGMNTDNSSLEVYTGSTYNWLIFSGIWTDIASAPITDTAPGSRGFVVGMGHISFDGTSWNLG